MKIALRTYILDAALIRANNPNYAAVARVTTEEVACPDAKPCDPVSQYKTEIRTELSEWEADRVVMHHTLEGHWNLVSELWKECNESK